MLGRRGMRCAVGLSAGAVLLAVAAVVPTTAVKADDGTVFLTTGKRLLVQTEGRDDYTPRIVSCAKADTELCLRDTRGSPPNNPIEHGDGGALRVTFESWGIIYQIMPDGTGRTFDSDGNELTPFTWEMIPE